MNLLATIWRHRELLWNLVGRDLKSRYKGSVLGFFWTILTPLFMAVIYIFFLRLLGGRGIAMEDIIIGVFAWQYTIQCVNAGVHCFTGNTNLVKKVFFPREILPLSITASSLVNFLLTLAVQFVLVGLLLWHRGAIFSGWFWVLPAVMLYQTVFNFELILVVSTANVYYRDTSYLVNLLVSAWFFMSPVMYPLSFVDNLAHTLPWLRDVYQLNPMTMIITAYRATQMPGEGFAWSTAAVIGWLWPLLAGLLIWPWFQRSQRYFADVL